MFSRSGANAVLFAGALLLGALVGGGCGHKGSPQPPPQRIPAQITDLKVTQRGDQMLVSFTYPQVTISGLPIEDIVAIELWKFVLPVLDYSAPAMGEEGIEGEGEGDDDDDDENELTEADPESTEVAQDDSWEGEETDTQTSQAAPEPETATSSEPLAGPQSTGPAARTGVVDDLGELDKLGEIGTTIEIALGEGAEFEGGDSDEGDDDDDDEDDDDAPTVSKESLLAVDGRQFAGASTLHTSLTGPELSNTISGAQVKMTLDLGKVEPGELEAFVYGVKSFQTLNRSSSFSNLATIIPRVTPDPPSQLKTSASRSGVKLSWAFEGEEPEEFRIYRRAPLQPSFDAHLGTREGDEDQFLDAGAAFGATYVYVVTAVINRTPLVETAFSEELEVGLVDEFAPEPPTDLVIFAEAGTARLLWEASDDDDLDGYFIHRKEADGDYVRLNDTPHRRTDYNDTEAASGRRYAYRIVAVDLSGNTSEPSEEVETRIP